MPESLLLVTVLGCAGDYLEAPEITSQVDDWRDEVLYQVIVDRFANGDASNDWNVTADPTDLARYQGGDWQGLIDHVDYLQELGVTAIWVSPVVNNVEEDAGVAGYHGYWTQAFDETNPHFGDLAKLRELVDVMHGAGIKVVVDIVANHVGQLFYYDINRNGQPDETVYYSTDGSDTVDLVTEWDPDYDSRGVQGWTSLGESGDAPLGWVDMPEINRVLPEPAEFANDDWYNRRGRVSDWDDLEQVVYGDFPGGLKDLATENPNVRAALIRVFRDWITETDIDGYRIDTVKHVEHDFWEEFCPAIREHAEALGKENFLLFGEVFSGDSELVGSYTQADMLDGLVDFPAKYQVVNGVFQSGGPTSALQAVVDERATYWHAEAQPGGVGVAPAELPLSFLDNHDVARFLFDADEERLTLALTWLMTTEGVPILYYGTEQGFSGGNDPANREPLWESGFATDGELFRHIATLAAARQDHVALRRGTMDLALTEDEAGLAAWERYADGDTVLVVVNTSDEERSGSVPVTLPDGTLLEDVLTGDVFSVTGGDVELTLEPLRGVVLAP